MIFSLKKIYEMRFLWPLYFSNCTMW